MTNDKNTTKGSMDSVCKVVKHLTVNRKKELESQPETTKALCDLAELAENSFMSIVDSSIKTDDAGEKARDTLFVLQLMYLKICKDKLENEELVKILDTYTGQIKTERIDTSRPPMYL